MKLKSVENVWKTSEKEREILQKELDSMRSNVVTSRRSLKEKEKIKEQNTTLLDERDKLNETVAAMQKELSSLKSNLKRLEEDKHKLSEALNAKVKEYINTE